MGVPQLIRHFANTHPTSVGLVPAGAKMHCDALYVDFNGLIHQAAAAAQCSAVQRAVASHREVASAPEHVRVAEDTIEERIIQAALTRLTNLIDRLQPRSHVYVAVDGVPPMAKMVQQRSRRFMAAWKDELASESGGMVAGGGVGRGGFVWNRNAITPGTEFMRRMGFELHKWSRGREGGGGAIPVVVSDATEKGEGEQKIFKAIRGRGRQDTLVFGLDADLVLMSLLLPRDIRDGIKVVREHDDVNVADYDYNKHGDKLCGGGGVLQIIRIRELGAGIVRSIDPGRFDVVERRGVTQADDDASSNALLRDFVYLCTFAGNDFVPGLPGFRIRNGALDVLKRAYRQTMTVLPSSSARGPGGEQPEQRQYLTLGGPEVTGGVRLGRLVQILRIVAGNEDATVEASDNAFGMRRQSCYSSSYSSSSYPGPNPNLNSNARTQQRTASASARVAIDELPVHLLPHGADDAPSISIFHVSEGWRLRYYRYMLGLCDYSAIRAMCLAYLAGTVWSLSYFEQRCLSEGWWYEHAYAPCASDLCNLLAEGEAALSSEVEDLLESTDRTFRSLAPLAAKSSCWTLLLVLPPSSASLVPDERIRAIMTDARSGCGHLFPRGFRLASYLKERVWECTPLLPGLDPGLVLHHVSRAVQ